MTATVQAHCPAIECAGCANSIKRSLGKLAGVEGIDVDVDAKRVQVQYDDAQLTEARIRERLEQAGFPAQ